MANLKVTITENLSLNGVEQGGSYQNTITGINDVFERIITCPNAATTTIATFSSNVYDSAGAIDKENVRYIRVSNLSTTYDIEIGVAAASSNYSMLIPAGSSHIIARADDVMVAEADTSPGFASFEDLANIQAKPASSTAVQMEMFVALT